MQVCITLYETLLLYIPIYIISQVSIFLINNYRGDPNIRLVSVHQPVDKPKLQLTCVLDLVEA